MRQGGIFTPAHPKTHSENEKSLPQGNRREHRKSAKTFSQTFSLSLSFQLPTQAEDDETSALRSSSRNAIKKISARKPKPPQTEVENANFSPSSCVSCLSAAGEVGYEQLLNY